VIAFAIVEDGTVISASVVRTNVPDCRVYYRKLGAIELAPNEVVC
jgi:hypothetical protein